MTRTILISTLDGLLAWLGVVLFIWLGYSRFFWKWPAALGVVWTLISFVRRTVINTLRSQVALSGSEKELTELELRKPSLGVTLVFVAVLCLVGTIIRYTR